MTHTFTRNFERLGETIPGSVTATGDAEINADPVLPTGDPTPIADYEVNLAVDVSAVKSVYIIADKACTANVNSGAGQLITLVANEPIEWVSTDAASNPLGDTDVTKLLFDHSNLSTVNVKIRILVDSTPV